MPYSCCAVGCANRSNTHPHLIFYSIPNLKHTFHQNRRTLWLQAIGRKNWSDEEITNARLCGAHFVSGRASMDSDSPDFVPSLFAHQEQTPPKSAAKMLSLRYERPVNRRKIDVILQGAMEREESTDPVEMNPEATKHVHQDPVPDTPDDNVSKAKYDELALKYQEMEIEYRNKQSQVHHLKEEVKRLTQGTIFGYETLKGKPELFTFYTGLPSIPLFDWIISHVKDNLPPVRNISVQDQVLIVIMKLRLGLLTKDMAHIFSLNTLGISSILRQTLPCLAKTLKPLILWPSKEAVRKHMPEAFRKNFRKCRCIINCTEVSIESPANLTSRAQTWSNNKHDYTIKYLIGITPAGAISFLSKGWGGCVSDKEITIKSEFFNFVEHGDVIMADRGFSIEHELAVHGATLAIPYFTEGQKQLSEKELDKSRQLATGRIHVERVIGKLKDFRILQSVIPLSLADLIDDIVLICAALTNMSPSVVA